MKITWKVITKEEYQQSLPHWTVTNEKGKVVIEGFEFFQPDEAYDEEEELIVLVLFHYEKPIAALSLEILKPNIYEINYLEVHASYRGRKLPEKVYKVLNEWVQEDTIIIGSDMTLEGRQANLHEKRNILLTNCKTFDYRRDYLKTLEEDQ